MNANSQFPVPLIENVYESWKPVDHGHPMRDATVYYSPPSLQRVRMDNDKTARSANVNVRSPNHARSVGHQNPTPLVIQATPKKQKKTRSYSVYGSPDVNYSKLYDNGGAKDAKSDGDESAFREDAATEFRRNHFDSAVESRAADEFHFDPITANRRRAQQVRQYEKVLIYVSQY